MEHVQATSLETAKFTRRGKKYDGILELLSLIVFIKDTNC
jgi:hypothetical protein